MYSVYLDGFYYLCFYSMGKQHVLMVLSVMMINNLQFFPVQQHYSYYKNTHCFVKVNEFMQIALECINV